MMGCKYSHKIFPYVFVHIICDISLLIVLTGNVREHITDDSDVNFKHYISRVAVYYTILYPVYVSLLALYVYNVSGVDRDLVSQEVLMTIPTFQALIKIGYCTVLQVMLHRDTLWEVEHRQLSNYTLMYVSLSQLGLPALATAIVILLGLCYGLNKIVSIVVGWFENCFQICYRKCQERRHKLDNYDFDL